jgi:hemolysin-activating ACP:hemolysin acyltransferase
MPEVSLGPAPVHGRVAMGIGFAAELYAGNPHKGKASVRSFLEEVFTPILLRQVRFYFSADESLAGMVTWALVTPEVLQRIVETERITLHTSEWKEGEILLATDLIGRNGLLKSVLRDARSAIRDGTCKEIVWARRTRGAKIWRIYRWNKR